MEAILRIKSSEFTDELIAKLKVLLSGGKETEITISITEKRSDGILREETRESYFSRLDQSLENLEKGNVITFDGESFDLFAKQIATE